MQEINVIPGSVLYGLAEFFTPPKTKFLIVVGQSADLQNYGCIVINSHVNPLIQKEPMHMAAQHCLRPADYGFLRYDSFVNCSQIYTLTSSRIDDLNFRGQLCLKGVLNESDVYTIVTYIQNCPLFSKAELRYWQLL